MSTRTRHQTLITRGATGELNVASRKHVRFENSIVNGRLSPRVGVCFQSDNYPGHGGFYPVGVPRLAEIDTGSDVSCLGTGVLVAHGIKEDVGSLGTIIRTVDRTQGIKTRTKHVKVRIADAPIEPLVMEIHYSKRFHEDLLLISWKWLRKYFDVFIDSDHTYLLWDDK